MLQFLSRIHWDEFFKSKTVISGLGSAITGAIAFSGHQIDPNQTNEIIQDVSQVCSGLADLLAVLTVVFRTTAQTAIMAPKDAAALAPVSPEIIPTTKEASKAVLQGLTAGQVVTPAQEAAAVQIIPQPLTLKP